MRNEVHKWLVGRNTENEGKSVRFTKVVAWEKNKVEDEEEEEEIHFHMLHSLYVLQLICLEKAHFAVVKVNCVAVTASRSKGFNTYILFRVREEGIKVLFLYYFFFVFWWNCVALLSSIPSSSFVFLSLSRSLHRWAKLKDMHE